jgi:hypothetical protein
MTLRSCLLYPPLEVFSSPDVVDDGLATIPLAFQVSGEPLEIFREWTRAQPRDSSLVSENFV